MQYTPPVDWGLKQKHSVSLIIPSTKRVQPTATTNGASADGKTGWGTLCFGYRHLDRPHAYLKNFKDPKFLHLPLQCTKSINLGDLFFMMCDNLLMCNSMFFFSSKNSYVHWLLSQSYLDAWLKSIVLSKVPKWNWNKSCEGFWVQG